jgi:hypothetical protein
MLISCITPGQFIESGNKSAVRLPWAQGRDLDNVAGGDTFQYRPGGSVVDIQIPTFRLPAWSNLHIFTTADC